MVDMKTYVIKIALRGVSPWLNGFYGMVMLKKHKIA